MIVDGAAAEHQQVGEAAEVVAHERHVGGGDGDLVSERAHRDAEIAGGEGRGVVEAVADHHDTGAGGLEGFDVALFVLRQAFGDEFGQAQTRGDALGDGTAVAGEHHDAADTDGTQAGDGLGAEAVGEAEGGDMGAVQGEADEAVRIGFGRKRGEGDAAGFGEPAEPAHADQAAIDGGGDAESAGLGVV